MLYVQTTHSFPTGEFWRMHATKPSSLIFVLHTVTTILNALRRYQNKDTLAESTGFPAIASAASWQPPVFII
jgi:hypothetical protein